MRGCAHSTNLVKNAFLGDQITYILARNVRVCLSLIMYLISALPLLLTVRIDCLCKVL